MESTAYASLADCPALSARNAKPLILRRVRGFLLLPLPPPADGAMQGHGPELSLIAKFAEFVVLRNDCPGKDRHLSVGCACFLFKKLGFSSLSRGA